MLPLFHNYLAPGHHAVKPPRFFATRCAKNCKVPLISVRVTGRTAASSIHVLSLQRHWHALARCASHDPCPAIAASSQVYLRLVLPYTTGPLSLKNQLHSHARKAAARAPPLVGKRACQKRPTPDAVVPKECCSGSDQNVMQVSSSLL